MRGFCEKGCTNVIKKRGVAMESPFEMITAVDKVENAYYVEIKAKTWLRISNQ